MKITRRQFVKGGVAAFTVTYAAPAFLSDLARAHVCALEWLERGGASDAYNLGNGLGASVKQVIESAERVTGLKTPIVKGARRPGDPAVLITDARKAREELGWLAEIADLEAIIATAWAWHQRKPA